MEKPSVLIEPRPLPIEDDYIIATDESTIEFGLRGGPRQAIISREVASRRSEKIFDEIYAAGVVALHIEDRDETGLAKDRTMPRMHAFKRGMMAGTKITGKVHGGHIGPHRIYYWLDRAANSMVNLSDPSDRDGDILRTLGMQGLEMMGTIVTKTATEWGMTCNQGDEETALLFTQGCGAAAMMGYILHSNDNVDISRIILQGSRELLKEGDISSINTGE